MSKCPHCSADVLVTHFNGKWLKCPKCKKSLKPLASKNSNKTKGASE